jgi:hypothetical protein
MKTYPQEADVAAMIIKCNRALPPNRPATISSNREVRFPLATCFVIQPFDEGGKFDKRYADVFEPAIRDAGLEPYRVDNDPSTTIPIDEIQEASAERAYVSLTLPSTTQMFGLNSDMHWRLIRRLALSAPKNEQGSTHSTCSTGQS